MPFNPGSHWLPFGLAAGVGVLLSPLAGAQQIAEGYVLMEEIVVTAQKREQSIQDVGISITALSGDAMKALGLDNTQEIIQQVPALQLQTFTPAFTIFNLRGVSQSNFTDNMESPVAVYVDDVYVASMNAIGQQMFDMNRVEVLRGPQGTLFGRNATGGLIHFVSRKADEEELNGYLEASAADFGTLGLEGAVGGALGGNVRGRMAARWETSDGYVEAGVNPFTERPATGRDTHGADGYSLRGSLRADVSERAAVDLVASYAKDDDVPTGMYIVSFAGADPDTGLGVPLPGNTPFDGGTLGGDVHKHVSNENPWYDREIWGMTAKVSVRLDDNKELASITNVSDVDKFYKEDACGGRCFFPFTTIADFTQWSQELRLFGEAERGRWQVGAYYLDIRSDTENIVEGETVTDSPLGIVSSEIHIDSTNWSLFGQVEYGFTDALTLIAGLRWSQDDKDLALQQFGFNMEDQGIPSGTVIFDLEEHAVGEWADVPKIDYGDYAARLQLNWRAGEDALWFIGWNRGIKGGNWTAAAAVTIDELRHDEEVLNSYEAGVKISFAGGLARFNATGFYYDYQDYQAFSIAGMTPQVANSDATAAGGELELFITPHANWDVVLGAAFIDSEVDFVPAVNPGFGTVDAAFPQAPSVSLNGLVRYHWSVAGGEAALQIDGIHNSKQFMEGTNSAASRQGSYAMCNLRASYSSERWSVAGWLKNVTDQEYLLYNLDLGAAGNPGFIEQVFAPPRQRGLTVRYQW